MNSPSFPRLRLAQALPGAAAAPQGPELRDIHLPPDPSWFPPAPGWWLLAAIVVAAAIWLLSRLRRRLKHRRWLAAIQHEVDRIERDHAGHRDRARTSADVSQLLRRASLLLDPAAAAYPDERWRAWLDRRGGGNGFVDGPGRGLADAPWRRSADVDVDALIALTRRWLATVFAKEPADA